jgi:hypothetical protein
MEAPIRAKLLIATDDPNLTNSRIDSVAPSRHTPNNDMFEPSRAKLLSAIDDPKCKKSMTDKDEPIRE